MAEKKQIPVGKPEDFPVGKMQLLTVEGREIGVVRMKSGELKAVRNHCPHKGAPVCKGFISGTALPSGVGEMVWGREGEILVCPWHGYEFDLNDGVEIFKTNPTRLLMYPVTEQGGQVLVTM
jgi:nitrite reductase/ring-hydroxylating ferredoxin subunit